MVGSAKADAARQLPDRSQLYVFLNVGLGRTEARRRRRRGLPIGETLFGYRVPEFRFLYSLFHRSVQILDPNRRVR